MPCSERTTLFPEQNQRISTSIVTVSASVCSSSSPVESSAFAVAGEANRETPAARAKRSRRFIRYVFVRYDKHFVVDNAVFLSRYRPVSDTRQPSGDLRLFQITQINLGARRFTYPTYAPFGLLVVPMGVDIRLTLTLCVARIWLFWHYRYIYTTAENTTALHAMTRCHRTTATDFTLQSVIERYRTLFHYL